jgi:uncharacterized membrane protein (UPF0127 family)
MEFRVCDLFVVKPGTHVPPGTRYSSGIILNVRNDPELTRWNGAPEIYLDILWVDGHRSTEDYRKVSPYYEVVLQ